MDERTRLLEIRVGIFVVIGIAIIGFMAVQFGRMGRGLREYYTLNVRLPNAGGILKGSDVLLAGARIGHVASKPVIAGSIDTVSVAVKIREEVKLPKTAQFEIGSSGLLGDSFVAVSPGAGFDPKTFNPEDPNEILHDGDAVEGTKSGGGLSELASKGGEVVDDLKKELAQVHDVIKTFHEGVLNDENLENLRKTFANLKTTSERFAEASSNLTTASAKVSVVLDEASVAVRRGSDTMATADAAAKDLRKAIGDAREALETARGVIAQARTGHGLIANLLTNARLADDLNALIANLRRHGVLFYKDSEAEPGAASPPTRIRRAGPPNRP